jgi:UDPglucose 6-dehydrogenase
MPDLIYCDNSYATMEHADALVFITEWNEFRALDLDRVKALLKTPTVVDLRNIYKPADMAAAGFDYFSIGRAAAKKSQTPQRKLA